ncbi:MAG: hypothetical protein EOP56_19505, partial [Sphingobacteriales bacterium]
MSSRLRIFKTLACTILVLLCMGVAQKAQACHWGSGQIHVEYIGAGLDGCTGTTEYKYRVTVTLYFACQGCTLEDRTPRTITVSSENGNVTDNFTITEIEYDTVSQICPNFWKRNSCDSLANAETYPAYRKSTFVGEYTFPATWTPQTDYIFSTQGGGRPSPIIETKNLQTGSQLRVEARINNLIKYNTSSPQFLWDPLDFKCVNQRTVFQNGPYDPNGDSVVVTNYTPLDFTGTVTWAPGYGLGNIIDVDPLDPYRLDPRTGTATFTPSQTGTYQIAFMASKYERGTGILLGYCMRDINMKVMTCNEPPPAVDSVPPVINSGNIVNTPNGKIIYTCPGNTLTFDVSSKAVLSTSQLYLQADLTQTPGATFDAPGNGSSAVTGTFEWTPSNADIGDHTLKIASKDSTCSGGGYTIVRKTETTYTIRVTPGLDLGPDVKICAINNSPKQLYVKNGDFLRLKWEEISNGIVMPGAPTFLSNPTIQNPIANPNRDITYRVSSPDLTGNCRSVDEMLMSIDSSTMVDAFPDNPVIMCKPDYLQLDARLTGDKPTGNIGCGTLKQITTVEQDTVDIIGSAAYGKLAIYDTIGPSTPVLPNDVKSAKMEYLILKDEIMAANMRSGTIKKLSFNIEESLAPTPQQYRNFTIKMRCTNLKKLSAAAGFQSENTMTTVYTSVAPLTFASNTTYYFELDQPYSWDTMQNLIIQICYANNDHQVTCTNPKGNSPSVSFVPTEYVSALFYKAPDTATKDICPVRTEPNIVEFATRPRFSFSYSEAPPEDYRIRWTGSLISDSTIQTPLAYIPRSMTYFVETFGRSGCIIRDSVEIYVPVRDYKILPGDTAVCYGADAVLKIDKGFHYKWYEYVDGQYRVPAPSTISCVNCREVRLRPLATTTYRIVVYDSVWCTDTIEARVKVLPLPIVKLLNKDTIIRYGASIPLLATGARQYNWLPSGSLSTPNTSAPIATPSERTQYVVMGIGANGCR